MKSSIQCEKCNPKNPLTKTLKTQLMHHLKHYCCLYTLVLFARKNKKIYHTTVKPTQILLLNVTAKRTEPGKGVSGRTLPAKTTVSKWASDTD